MDINQISASDWLDAVKKKKTDWYIENGLPVPDFTKEEDFYIVNAVENDIRALVDKELAAANERFPQFHSQHEGYAVIQEEVDELKEEANRIDGRITSLRARVRFNSNCEELVSRIYDDAVNAACEAVQVAAMCKKFLEMEGKQCDN